MFRFSLSLEDRDRGRPTFELGEIQKVHSSTDTVGAHRRVPPRLVALGGCGSSEDANVLRPECEKARPMRWALTHQGLAAIGTPDTTRRRPRQAATGPFEHRCIAAALSGCPLQFNMEDARFCADLCGLSAIGARQTSTTFSVRRL